MRLTIKAPITSAADDVFFSFFFIFCFSNRIGINISCEWCAKQTIHMKCQDIFSEKKKKKKKKKNEKNSMLSATNFVLRLKGPPIFGKA